MASVVVPIDSYSPIIQGDTGSSFVVQILRINEGYRDLTNATITMKMQNVDNPSNIKTCSGPWAVNGTKASYGYQDEDVDEPGDWKMWVKVVENGDPVHPDDGDGEPKILKILPLPSGV